MAWQKGKAGKRQNTSELPTTPTTEVEYLDTTVLLCLQAWVCDDTHSPVQHKTIMIVRKGLALMLTVLLAADRSQSFVGASREGNDAAAMPPMTNDAAGSDASEGVGDGSCANDPSSPSDSGESCLPSTAKEKPRDDNGSEDSASSSSYDDDEEWSEDDGSVDWSTRENGHTAENNENRTVTDMWANL